MALVEQEALEIVEGTNGLRVPVFELPGLYASYPGRGRFTVEKTFDAMTSVLDALIDQNTEPSDDGPQRLVVPRGPGRHLVVTREKTATDRPIDRWSYKHPDKVTYRVKSGLALESFNLLTLDHQTVHWPPTESGFKSTSVYKYASADRYSHWRSRGFRNFPVTGRGFGDIDMDTEIKPFYDRSKTLLRALGVADPSSSES